MDGPLNAIQNDRVTAEEVRAEDLELGDQVRLSTQFGARAVRLTSIEPRANGIKFIGIDDDGARKSFGFRQEEIVLRIRSASSPGRARMSQLIAHELMTLGTANPRIGVDGCTMPSRYLTIDGVPAYQIGYSCGTCGLVLRRQPGAPSGSLSAAAVRDRLNAGLDGLDMEVIDAFAARLPRGDYQVMLLDTLPTLVTPGSTGDYFAVDGPAGWRNEEFEYSVDPANTNYYRLDRRRVGDHDELFEFAVPMGDSTELDADVVARYSHAPGRPTAVAFGLLDIESPWFRRERHWGLFHFLLDGHHKTAAAAVSNTPIRLLTFVSAGESLASDDELLHLPEIIRADGRGKVDR